MSKDKLVMPGDQLSTSEELLPGDGTYEEDGIIRASRIGTYQVDQNYRKAMVKPVTSTPVVIRKGDTVLAEVAVTRTSMVIANVIHVIGKHRGISGDTNATIHASEIARSYIKDAQTEYKTGDIIRARVFQVTPSIQLTTKDSDLGVIKALCTKCRNTLDKKDNMLECPNCGSKEHRNIANDFGNINIDQL